MRRRKRKRRKGGGVHMLCVLFMFRRGLSDKRERPKKRGGVCGFGAKEWKSKPLKISV